jgi:alanyl-tRNA synthetase
MSRSDKPSVNTIRAQFLDYFRGAGHEPVASAPLAPQGDSTLLFVNAGMVPFKNYFTGAESPPFPRAVSSQKCVRAGGKHNDLDNVGYTARHHTFFEMLGNFSFGDYFKADAIALAWELITKEWALPKSRLCVTIYHDDEEARGIWKKVSGLDDSKIIPIATSDNFWSMGDTGPCGPCSEIFYDHGDHIFGGPPGSADQDGDRFVEIWNLVFMQYEQLETGERTALPKPSIDTGMGLERIAAVLQGVHSNYEIDLFQKLIAVSVELTGQDASGPHAASHRVIADHLRASCFLIADGVSPANEGRGYVLRRIMRRAMRHAHILGAREPLMHRLVGTLIGEMGKAYPELPRAEAVIADQLLQEEERFRRTLDKGLSLLEEETVKLGAGGKLNGAIAFKLYDTFGFPLDLTQDILRGKGMTVDTDGFDTAMERQREKGRESWTGAAKGVGDDVFLALKDKLPATLFTGYEDQAGEGVLAAIVTPEGAVSSSAAGDEAALIFDRTPFYAESGGQSGDHGLIRFAAGATFEVRDVQKRAGVFHVHFGRLIAGAITTGEQARLAIDAVRRTQIRANHSATHLLHAALRRVLGPHVAQKGSLVEADRFRFDFSHGAPVSAEEIEQLEADVNAVVRENASADTRVMAIDDAIAAGALAMFGEKYGDEVRVLAMGGADEAGRPYSVELCGGTHVTRTGDIAVFAILSESGVAAGVRRIEATTGAAALAHLKGEAKLAKTIAATLKAPLAEAPERVVQLAGEKRKLELELADAKKRLALAGGAGAAQPAGPEQVAGVAFIGRVLEGVAGKDLRGLVDEGKAGLGSGIVAYIVVEAGKATLAVGVSDDLKARISAVDLVKIGVAAVGGQGGGGRADMAQGGGPDGDKAEAALAAIRAALVEKLVP